MGSVQFKMVNTYGKIFDNKWFLFILNFSGLLFAIGAVHTIIDPNIHLGPLLMLIGIGIPSFLLLCICMIKCIQRSTAKTKPTSTIEVIDVEIREIEECDSEQLQNVKYEIDFSYSEAE